jgi:hypothetical protein
MDTASTFTQAEAGACFVGEDYSPPQVSDFHGRRQLHGEARRTLLLGRTMAGVVRRAARSSPGRAQGVVGPRVQSRGGGSLVIALGRVCRVES